MFNPEAALVSTYMPSFETAARSLKVEAITAPVHSDVEIETAIVSLGREPGGGVVVLPDIFMFVHRAPIISAAARNNVPAVYMESFFARDGGLLSYGVDQVDNFRRAASYVDRILRCAKPAELPIQLPTKREPQDRQRARPCDTPIDNAARGRSDRIRRRQPKLARSAGARSYAGVDGRNVRIELRWGGTRWHPCGSHPLVPVLFL
jgi:putative ABC transport system substrate-binding protein